MYTFLLSKKNEKQFSRYLCLCYWKQQACKFYNRLLYKYYMTDSLRQLALP